MPLYAYLRVVTATSLIAFAIIISVGVLALLPAALELPLVAGEESSDPSVTPCKRQNWLPFDRNCLSRGDLPWMAGHRPSNAATVESPSAGETAPEQPLPESQHTATVPEESAQRSDIALSEQLRRYIALPQQVVPAPPLVAEEPAKPAVEAPVHLPAPKKVVRRDRAAKRPASEALSAVRRFGDNLRDIPVSAYGADGTRRTIVIRPTSIQDVYYYSAPR